MGVVRVGDVDVAYGVEGSGPPVVLLHGTTSWWLSPEFLTDPELFVVGGIEDRWVMLASLLIEHTAAR